MRSQTYVSRAGEKLAAALDHFEIDVAGWTCADLGSHVGGFVDCLLQRGAARVYAVDTAYGTLAWKLRKDPRVAVMERTNAMHVALPNPVDFVTIDVGWTRQAHILPNARLMLAAGGRVVTLIKPHYEAEHLAAPGAGPFHLIDGVLPDDQTNSVLNLVLDRISSDGWEVRGVMESPLRGHGGNREYLALLSTGG